MTARAFFSFPDPVNEVAVRVTATGVAALAIVTLATRQPWPLVALAYGFVARAAAGPRLSPLAQLSVRVIAPRLSRTPRLVPGPPKRFAQCLGAAVSMLTVALYFGLGWHGTAFILTGLMATLAILEAAWRLCVGCAIYGWLIRRRLVSAETCVECADPRLAVRAGR